METCYYFLFEISVLPELIAQTGLSGLIFMFISDSRLRKKLGLLLIPEQVTKSNIP
jgi:hypothetical protein